jgi:hypothetical protein
LEKIKIYVYSPKTISLVEFTDMESAGHPCSRATDKEIFGGIRRLSTSSWDGILSETEMKIIDLVKEISEKHGLEFEIINLDDCNFVEKTKLILKGIKAPAICFKDKIIQGTPTAEELERLIRE